MHLNNEKTKTLLGISKDLIQGNPDKIESSLALKLLAVLTLLDESSPAPLVRKQVITEKLLADNIVDESEQKLKPVQAVRKLFNENPNKIFSPPGIRDHLKKLKEGHELEHRGKSLLITAHTTLRVLLKQKEIEFIKKGQQDPVYRLAKKNSELLL